MTSYSDTHPESIWLYPPSLALAIVFTVLYFIPTAYSFYLTVLRYRSWFFLCVLIGGILEVAGYVVRVVSSKNQESIPPYAVSLTLIILAPIFVAAGNYLLISRLVLAVLPSSNGPSKILKLPSRHITKVFVTCDILTFLIQAGGSGIASSSNWEGTNAETGQNVILAGLSIQVATVAFFFTILVTFTVKVKREGERRDAPVGWGYVLWSIYTSIVMILIRCIYRLIEFAQGVDGYTFTHEWTFYVFEAAPMLPAIAVFCVFHPAKYLMNKERKTRADIEAPSSVPAQL